jgi:hypothetical protein
MFAFIQDKVLPTQFLVFELYCIAKELGIEPLNLLLCNKVDKTSVENIVNLNANSKLILLIHVNNILSPQITRIFRIFLF